MPTNEQRIKIIQTAEMYHREYWDSQKVNMKLFDDAYNHRWWSDQQTSKDSIRVEINEVHSHIQTLIASIFAKAPAVTIEGDKAKEGNKNLAGEVSNRFLYDSFEEIQNGSRMALLYTNSFFKLAPCGYETESVLDSISIRPVVPWEVLVDFDAIKWEDQRFVGHTYYMPVMLAKARWGMKQFKPVPKENFLGAETNYKKDVKMPEEFLYIKIIEFYDLLNDELIFYTENWKEGPHILESMRIPVRTHDDKPLPAIAPIYFDSEPDAPLKGLSSIVNIYEFEREKNIVRTSWANAVRRDVRQYLYREGDLDDDALNKIKENIESSFIPVAGSGPLSSVVHPLPIAPLTSNHDRYLQQIEQDLQKVSILAPFSHGESSKGATATEIRALYAYSASEVGRLARARDAAIEKIAEIYVRMVSALVEEKEINKEPNESIVVSGKPMFISKKGLEGKFKFAALDQATTPVAEELKREQFMNLIPIVIQLGITPDQIRKQLVNLYDGVLPPDWADAAQQPQQQQPPPEAAGMPAGAPQAQSPGTEPGVARDGLPIVPSMDAIKAGNIGGV